MKPVDSTPALARLRDTSSSALTAALHGLSARGPDASELASLASRLSLQGISMTPPSSAASPRPAARHPVWQLGVAGAVAVGAAAWWLWPAPAAPRAAGAPATAPSMAPLVVPTSKSLQRQGSEAQPAPNPGTPPAAAEPSRAPAPLASAPSPELPPGSLGAVAPGTVPPRAIPTVAGADEPESEAPRDVSALRKPSQALPPYAAANESQGPTGTATAPSELELLRAARLSLKSSPTEALRLAEQHRTFYPSGKLTQERELIAISALVALGRRTSALSRAAGFERAFPTSPYRKQIGELLQ